MFQIERVSTSSWGNITRYLSCEGHRRGKTEIFTPKIRKEVMNCSFCNKMTDSHKIDRGTKSYVCSNCVQLFLNQPIEKLIRAYDLAIKKNCPEKAGAIESFMEANVDGKTKKSKRNLVRKRLGRKIRLTRDEVRSQ
jgi:hypothetical protein